ncbi:glycosyltransferase [Geodermatophilus maliterrae]|uniref:Glycosyltransferase n=1 Tax=Geodermatophilus maliterrae TaxID=3162531 RepID=A0ABV3XD87_9ACTN
MLVIVENLPLARDRRLGKQTGALVAAGYDVTVVCRSDPGNRALAGVDVAEYAAPRDATSKFGFVREYGYSWLRAALAFLRVAVRPGFDVLQLCGPPDIYFPLGLLARALGKPTVYDQRDPSPELYATRYGSGGGTVHRILLALEAATYRSADHVVTVNGTLERLAHTRGGVPGDRVTIVGNGPVLAATSNRTPRPELRNGRAHLCCWAGVMGPQDRLDLAVRAVSHLVHETGRTDCHFAFVGDGEARADAVHLARELGVAEWVSFPGFLPSEGVYTYLATADVGIEPGVDPTVSPVKVMEYMSFGLPLVAFDVLEARLLARAAALYAAPGDVAGFADRISRLLDDPVARRRMGAAGRSRVEETLAWDHQAPAYLAVFDRLLHPDGMRGGRRPLRPRTGTAARPARGRRSWVSAG